MSVNIYTVLLIVLVVVVTFLFTVEVYAAPTNTEPEKVSNTSEFAYTYNLYRGWNLITGDGSTTVYMLKAKYPGLTVVETYSPTTGWCSWYSVVHVPGQCVYTLKLAVAYWAYRAY